MDKNRVFQLAAAAGCMIIVLCGIYFLAPKYKEVTVVNQAVESVIKATVEINGTQFDLADIPPGETRKLKYRVRADNHYSVSVEFHFERKLGPQAGFFTDRVKTDHRLVIKQESIVLESGKD